MAKLKSSYFCQSCGAQSAKWIGRCPACSEWNTYVEELIQKEDKPLTFSSSTKKVAQPKPIVEIEKQNLTRIKTKDQELNRVLGGGIVPGSLILIGGEPGIGKSTLMLQIALQVQNHKVLYVSGEESEHQIKMRAERIGLSSSNCYVLSETNTQNIFKQIELLAPALLIIDSIQTMNSAFIESASGSISQVKECAAEFMKFAKESNIPVFLIGHITKDGSLAGPKVLEHMVDTVLHFEGDRHLSYRIVRSIKNRFGSTSELGIYEMKGEGLREVNNPSEILLSQRDEMISGVTISSMMEGNRPMMIEIQSLVSVATYGTPQRSSTGYDAKRLNMLLAVLEKRVGLRMGTQDVFLNIAGGLKVEDPAIDLAVCMSIASSYNDFVVPNNICFAGEVGLGGEIRAVNKIEQRLLEAEKLGFKSAIISKYNTKGLDLNKFKIKVTAVASILELFDLIGMKN